MSPIEKIKQGILSGDIQIVHEGYVALTGENLLDDMIELATEAHQKATKKKATKKKATKKKVTRKKTAAKKATRKKAVEKRTADKSNTGGFIIKDPENDSSGGPVKFSGNLFESIMGYAEEMTDAEREELKKISPAKLDKYIGVSKDCVKCGKTFEVHPSRVIPGTRFWCDKCLISR